MATFTVNGKEYTAPKELDFEYLAVLEDFGVNLDNLSGLSATRAFLAFVGGMSKEQASKEISAHVIANNGEFPTEMSQIAAKLIEESDFFQALIHRNDKTEEEMATETEEETPEKKSKKA